MNIIYVGFLYPVRLKEELLQLGSAIDFPGDKFQHGLLQGLDAVQPGLTVVSSAFMSPYPKIKKIFFRPERYSHNGGTGHDKYVGGVNLPLFKMLSEFIRIRRGIKRQLSYKDPNVVILYELHTPFMLAVKSLCKKIDVTCLIVPDLPEYMRDKRSLFYKVAKRLDRRLIDWCSSAFDTFVLFSPHMKERLRMEGKRWCNVEGVFRPTGEIEEAVEKDPHKVILFTGALTKRVGIIDLLDAFERIEGEDYRLWIRGDGAEIKQMILEKAKKDPRIVYYERMSAEDLAHLQKKATVLINPVRPAMGYTRYFFPSKTMEYLASGTPTIMYHLDCIPKEYDEHIYYINEESIDGLKNTIVEVCSKAKEELEQFGKKASEFILKKKNPEVQATKIMDMIKNQMNNKSEGNPLF